MLTKRGLACLGGIFGLLQGAAIGLAAAQSAPPSGPPSTLRPERVVHGRVLESPRDPAVRLTFDTSFVYVGGQRFLIRGAADAEQHVFADADAKGLVRRLFWIQFEHWLPGAEGTYSYPSPQRILIGGLDFITDTRVFADYADTVLSTDSAKSSVDQAWVGRLLRARGYTPPRAAIRARMVHVMDRARRKELMIIYALALLPSDLGGRTLPAISAGDNWPDLSHRVIEEAGRKVRIDVGEPTGTH